MIYSAPPSNFAPRAEVAACYIEYDGKILFLRRKLEGFWWGTWGTPGGKIDAWEHFTEAAIRETFEETGIRLDSSKIKFLEKVYVRHKTHDIIYYTHHSMIEHQPIIVLAESEHIDFCWKSPEEALKLELIEDEDLCIKKFFKLYYIW